MSEPLKTASFFLLKMNQTNSCKILVSQTEFSIFKKGIAWKIFPSSRFQPLPSITEH